MHDDSRELCGGNGMLFDGRCECDDCWEGSTCSVPTPPAKCIVNANSGTPIIFENYWIDHPEVEMRIRPSYHIGYGASIGCGGGYGFNVCDQDRMVNAIRRLHRDFGNFDTTGFEVIVGVGSTALIPAAVWVGSP